VAAFVGFWILVPDNIVRGIKPLVAPRVVLVEKMAEIAKGVQKK
jgi:hypothetical protein